MGIKGDVFSATNKMCMTAILEADWTFFFSFIRSVVWLVRKKSIITNASIVSCHVNSAIFYAVAFVSVAKLSAYM